MIESIRDADAWPIPVSPEETLRSVIRNCAMLPGRRKVYTVPRWSVVSEVTRLGIGPASALCRWAGVDPDELVVRRR